MGTIGCVAGNPPQVSVVIPTYNRSNLLSRALRSATRQEIDTVEFIVVDDGSTDSTCDVVNAAIEIDPRIRYIYQDTQGPAGARNSGMVVSVGKYVTFLDSDDEYLPTHLSLRTEFMDMRSDIQMIHGGLEVVNGSSMVPDFYRPGEMIDLRECAVGATFFFRRSMIDLVGLFEHREYGEDTEYFARAQKLAKVERVHWPTYRYFRNTSNSIVSAEIQRNADNDIRMVELGGIEPPSISR